MVVRKSQMKATQKYEAANYDKILLRVPKGDRERIKARAELFGISLNAYITSLIDADIERPPNN